MVQLDHVLLASARSLTTGDNIHLAAELIFSYEQAVSLHNQGTAGHVTYREIHEKELRSFVIIQAQGPAQAAIRLLEDTTQLQQSQAVMQERSQAVMRR